MDGPAFDELTRALRSASTRRQAAGGLLGLGVAVLTGRSLTAAKGKRHAKHGGNGARQADGPGGTGGNSACAHFCAAVFGADTPAAGQCTSDAAHGKGLCHTCGAVNADQVCCVQQNGVCPDYENAHCCTGTDTCGGGNPGTPGVCGCTPATTCPNGQTCGTAQNGCRGTMTCTGCQGCCDGNACNDGADNGACGKHGDACVPCQSPQVCYQHACCTPNCTGRCGGADNGCGGTCDGSCPSGWTCLDNGTCVQPCRFGGDCDHFPTCGCGGATPDPHYCVTTPSEAGACDEQGECPTGQYCAPLTNTCLIVCTP